jgi:GTP-binding protein HflX
MSLENSSLINKVEGSKCLIVIPYLKKNMEEKLLKYNKQEAIGLAESINLQIEEIIEVPLNEFNAGYLLKQGKLDYIKDFVDIHQVEVVYIDYQLTPPQQRNLEKYLGAKIIDRTALILEIFAERAKTKEGILQVRLAYLEYQKSRLVKLWSHLERQRGGMGKTGGPGETQKENDKRMIKEEITRIKAKLEKVKNTRELHRKAREKVPYPIIAIVGYTNAGKSTLFNYLTKSEIYAKNQLFATLDPTMRMLRLSSNKKVIFSDTVGFINNLPHELVAAFRATLEEVVSADLIIHLIDGTSYMQNLHFQNVERVIAELNIAEKWKNSTIHVINKLDDEEFDDQQLEGKFLQISAKNGQNCDKLLHLIEDFLSKKEIITQVEVLISEGEKLNWLYEHAKILSRKDYEDKIKLELRITEKFYNKWHKLFEIDNK